MNEGRIELRDFGVFEVKRRKPRKARNPQSGETVQVPERVAVRFKPGKEMEEQVNQAMMAVGQVTFAASITEDTDAVQRKAHGNDSPAGRKPS